MSLPATCVKDPFLYDRLLHGGLVAPITVGEVAIMPADLPHGAFGNLVRDKIDPLWGGYDLAPDEWNDLSDLLAEVKPKTVAERSLWAFDPQCLLNRTARMIQDRGAQKGNVHPSMATMLADIHSRIDPFGGDYGLEDEAEHEADEEDAPAPIPSTADLAAAVPDAPAAPQPATPSASNTNGFAEKIAPQPATTEDARMQFTADKAPLLVALRKAAGLVPKKTTMPILSHILLDVGNDLTISGTDLAVDVQVTMSIGMGATPGKVAAPGADLVSAIAALQDGAQVTLERTEDGRLRILSGRARFHLPIRQPDEMPAFVEAAGHEIRAQAQEWRKAIDRTSWAMATDAVVKAPLCGLFLHARREGLRVVGMDSNILSRSDLAVTAPARDYVAAYEDVEGSPGILIPRESIGILRRLLGDAADAQEVVATVNAKRVVFDLSPVRFGTTLSAAQFPPYESMIEHNHQGADRRLAVPRADFLACVERVRVLAGDKNRAVALTVTAEGVRIATTGESGTDAVDILEYPTRYEDSTLRIGFASGALVSSLQSLGDPALLCDLNDHLRPTFWRAIQEEDISAAEHLVIVVPYRVNAPAGG